MKLQVVQPTGKTATHEASDAVFAAPVNEQLVAQMVRVYRANARQGTSKVQTRSEVSLTTRKMYKQKGTGNARHHAQSAPIFVGGGAAHGPKGVENWSLTASKKQKKQALISAFSWQAPQIVVTELAGTKTKEMAQLIATVAPEASKVLVVVPADSEVQVRALRNLPQVTIRAAARVNTLDIAAAQVIVMTKDSVAEVEARLSGAEKAPAQSTQPAAQAEKKAPAKKAAQKKTTAKKTPAKKSTKKTEKK